jgi:putative ABC transport system substrate-binding protein
MVLDGEAEARGAGVVTRVLLDVPPAAVLARLRQLFPSRRRLGVVLGRGQPSTLRAAIQGQAGGWAVEFVECNEPKRLLEAIPALQDRVDLLWCLPDRSLYQPATVTALILASIRNRLPLIGFSEGFVKAGALVAFYADYRDLGAQTAEVVRRYREGQAMHAKEAPRTVKTVINERVLRVLGIGLPPFPQAGGLEFVK